jgi:ceramide kinase
MFMQMHRFVVHGITRRRKHPSPWVPCEYIFGHKDLKICTDWFERLISCINNEGGRPKNLMVVSFLLLLTTIALQQTRNVAKDI